MGLILLNINKYQLTLPLTATFFAIDSFQYLAIANQRSSSYNIDSKIYRWHVPHNDFDGDGKVDILWRNSSTGVNALWLMNDSALKKIAMPDKQADTNLKIVGTGDFDG